MDNKLNLDSNATLSDNITRIRMQGASLSSPDVLEKLIAVTRKGGFSRWELADARSIQANLHSRGDPDADALHGVVEEILKAREKQSILDSLKSFKEVFRENKLPGIGWRENQLPDREAEQVEKIRTFQKRLLENPGLEGKKDRVFHQKPVLACMCKLVIRDNLLAYAKIGPFAQPGEFRAAIRFSNGQGHTFSDKEADVRGMAIKFFTRDGEETDMLMTNAPASFARNTEQFLKVTRVLVEQQVAGGGFKGMLAAGEEVVKGLFEGDFNPFETARIAKEITEQTVLNQPESLATQQFWGSVVRLGDYAVKMTLVPTEDVPEGTMANKDDGNYLRKDLESRIQNGDVKYTLRLLYFTDEDITPLNDASKSWDDSPAQVDVADIEISASQPEQAAKDENYINKMPFNPANGFEGLAITRARQAIYRASAQGRGASGREDYERFF